MQKTHGSWNRSVGRPVGSCNKAPPLTRSEFDVPEFAGLAKLAEARGIIWKRRPELYRGLGLSRKQKIEIEGEVVEHCYNGLLTQYWMEKIVNHNLFYLCADRSGKPVFEDQFLQACKGGVSIRVSAERLNLTFATARRIKVHLGLKSTWKRPKRVVSEANGPKPNGKPVNNGGGNQYPMARSPTRQGPAAVVAPRTKKPVAAVTKQAYFEIMRLLR